MALVDRGAGRDPPRHPGLRRCPLASLTSFDVAVVGAGILGLATARELLERDAGLRIVVLEKEPRVAAHQTSHNSGVIHSGIYYRPGSEKARLCVQGRALLLRYLAEREIPHELCGKLIVALGESEVAALRELERRAAANGVDGVRAVAGDRIRDIEPHIRGLAALHVPSAGIVDFALVATRLAAELRTRGVEIRLGTRVTGVEPSDGPVRLRTRAGTADGPPRLRTSAGTADGPVRLRTSGGTVEARSAIACAGLRSDDLARLAGAPAVPRIVPFRGDYYVLRPERRDLVRGLVYPVPDPRFPFLGIHFTRRMGGDVWLGPNAVLAFAREGYRRRDLNVGDLATTLAYSGFRRMALRYWRTGVAEMFRDWSKGAFLAALRAYLPELRPSDVLPGPSGVRAQAVGPGGELLDDFAFDTIGRLLNVRNAPSPAATSAFALARVFADRLEEFDR